MCLTIRLWFRRQISYQIIRGQMNNDTIRFHLSRLNDPIAMQTEWTQNGSDDKWQQKLVHLNSNRLEFRVSRGKIAVIGLLFFMFPVLFVIGIWSNYYEYIHQNMPLVRFTFDFHMFISLLFTLLMVTVSLFTFYTLYTDNYPIIFDKQMGFFWKGWSTPNKVSNKYAIKHFSELEKIHALQIISVLRWGDCCEIQVYQLNLVLENGKRINVADRVNQKKLREEAGILSAFLEKPIWDVT